MTLDALWEVVAPKAIGALLIDAGCAAAPLDFCCFFSSITAITGSSGLAHYTAANAFCDALASHRNGSGRRYLSINWGIWEEMHSMTKTNRDRVLLAGLRPMDEAGALDALGSLILSESSQAIVSATDWRLLRAAYEVRRPRPIFAEVNGRPKRPDLPVETPVADCTGKAVRSVAQQAVCEELIRVLDLPADTDLDEDRGFFELGMDSLLSVEFVNHLNDRLQCSLSSSAPFHFPTIRDLAAHIARPAERPETWREPSNPERDNGSGLRADAVVDRLRAALQRS
jgi:acyl carrier protein